MKKTVITLAVLSSIIFTTIPTYTLADVHNESTEYSDFLLKDIIKWVYKTENGKAYKRQYNFSKGHYVGPWILMK